MTPLSVPTWGGQTTPQTRKVFLSQKNTMQKHFTPVGSFCRSVLSEEHFNKNTSHPWGLFVDRTFPLQKDFTPLGSFCRSVLQKEHFDKKTPGVSSHICQGHGFHRNMTFAAGKVISWVIIMKCSFWENTSTKRLHTPGVFLLTVLFLYKKTSHPWGLFVEVFFLKNTSTKRLHTRGVFLLTVLLIRTTLGFSLTKRPQTRKAWP